MSTHKLYRFFFEMYTLTHELCAECISSVVPFVPPAWLYYFYAYARYYLNCILYSYLLPIWCTVGMCALCRWAEWLGDNIKTKRKKTHTQQQHITVIATATPMTISYTQEPHIRATVNGQRKAEMGLPKTSYHQLPIYKIKMLPSSFISN